VPDCRLLIVGRDDGYLGMLEQVISQYNLQSKIIIHGPLYDSDRFFAYRAADSFVFTPTIYEETGTACLEALGSRTPVITTKQASIPFLTRDDGVLEIECTPTSITQAMLDHIKQTPTVNIEKLNVHFSWQNISVQMIKSYEEAYDK